MFTAESASRPADSILIFAQGVQRGRLSPDHRQPDPVLENAFAHFGGVPKTLVPDNLKAAVIKADWYDPDLNPSCVRSANTTERCYFRRSHVRRDTRVRWNAALITFKRTH